MALVKCPWCHLTISDAVSVCPHCGKPTRNVSSDMMARYNQPIARSPQTPPRHTEVIDVDDFEEDDDEERGGNGKKALIIVAILLVIAIPIGIFGYSRHQKAARRDEYVVNLFTIKTQMLLASSAAEDAASLVHDVWYNTIHKEENPKTDPYTKHPYERDRRYSVFNDDFNDSLRALYVSDKYQTYLDFINEQSEEIADLFGKLQNPPEDLTSAYAVLDNMYDEYQTLISCATNPSGSLITYTQQFNSARDNFIKYYEKLEAVAPETDLEKRAEALLENNKT